MAGAMNDLLDRATVERALREYAVWLTGQREALTAAVEDSRLETPLGVLVRTAVEGLGEGVRAAFYLADEDGKTLRHVVGMSEEYARKVDGFAIGPDSLACGLATHLGTPVLTVDVETEPRWEPWRWLAEEFGYRGCWSFPIRSTAGSLVGTLALYWPEPREATARELEVAELMTNTAAIVIARHREAEERTRAQADLRTLLAEREALLQELHHRVKNNLQVIASLLEMQARGATSEAPPLQEARNRISAIAAIHELLYQSESFSEIDFAAYARRLVQHVASLYGDRSRMETTVEGEGIRVDLARAVPLGLLLNELVSNAYKHAYAPGTQGHLRIALAREDGHIRLRVADRGAGLPEGFGGRETLGVQLVRMLAKQLGGSVTFESRDGTSVEARVPAHGPPLI